MAQITEPEVITFSNEQLRPLSETMTALTVKMRNFLDWYQDRIKPILDTYADPDTLEDNRQAQGVSLLTKLDIVRFRNKINTLTTELELAGTSNIIQLPNVRPLEVVTR